jgi:anti-sigma factor RsiW
MNNPVLDELIRLSLKRELTDGDRARIEAALAAHPELREQYEADAALGRALRSMSNAPVSFNFTSRVLDQIDLDDRNLARAASRSSWREWLRRVQPRVSWAFALAVVVAFGAYQYRINQSAIAKAQIHHAQLVHEMRSLSHLSSDLAAVPAPEVLKDFDAINQFRQVTAVSDDDLLKVLQ